MEQITDCSWVNPEEVEQDGFKTWEQFIKPHEYIETHGNIWGYAREAKACIYPMCEECEKYNNHTCTQPIVLTRQLYELTNEIIANLNRKVSELETIVYNEILGDK